MRYWWVNQNQTYHHEVQGGYLWSPKRRADGARNPYYETMREVAPGDLIFSFMDTRIRRSGSRSPTAGKAPSLILAHLNREALLHDSPRIEVESSLTAFVKRVLKHHSPNTREIGRFKDQLTRLSAALVRMAVSLPNDRGY